MTETMDFKVDVMIDIETLSTAPDAEIISVGAVPFRLNEQTENFHENNLWRPRVWQLAPNGGRIDRDTIAWWMKQGDLARAHAFPETGYVSFLQFNYELETWLHELDGTIDMCPEGTLAPAVRIWGHGPHFDMAILDMAHWRNLGRPAPWKYNAVRDTRTLWHAAGIDWDTRIKELNPDHAHDPVEDAIAQAKLVQEAWAKLKEETSIAAFGIALKREIAERKLKADNDLAQRIIDDISRFDADAVVREEVPGDNRVTYTVRRPEFPRQEQGEETLTTTYGVTELEGFTPEQLVEHELERISAKPDADYHTFVPVGGPGSRPTSRKCAVCGGDTMTFLHQRRS